MNSRFAFSISATVAQAMSLQNPDGLQSARQCKAFAAGLCHYRKRRFGSATLIDKAKVNVDVPPAMSLDLNTMPERLGLTRTAHQSAQIAGLDGGEIAVARRSWCAADGNESTSRWSTPAQLRVASGLSSKAGGSREQKGEAYELTPEQCAELQQEGIQYYHRYLSLFQINDFTVWCATPSAISIFHFW